MNHHYTIDRQVAAGHSISGHPRCKHQHGHDWTVSVTVKGIPDIDAASNVSARLDAFIDEIWGKNLNDLNPAGSHDTSGVALWAWERLAMVVPGLAAVEVSIPGERSRVSA